MKRALLLITLFAVGAFANNRPATLAEHAVLIHAHPERDEEVSVLQGSGLAFKYDDKAYVLTAESSVQAFGTLLSVENKWLGRVKAELVGSDWGRGLALLSLPTEKRVESLKALGEIEALTLKVGDLFQLADLSNQIENTAGPLPCAMMSIASAQTSIPFEEGVLQVTGCQYGLGLHGGSILSDHKGLHSMIGFALEQTTPAEPFFVIPWAIARNWAANVINRSSLSTAVRNPLPKLLGEGPEVYTHGLAFRGHFVADNGGTGGSDGTGRKHEVVAAEKSMHVRVEMSDVMGGWFPFQLDFFQALHKRLGEEKTLVVTHFVAELNDDASGTAPERKMSFESMAEFFRLLKNPNLRPVIVSAGRVN